MKERLQDCEISISNVFWAVCLKWRTWIAAGLILAVLMGCFSYYRSYKGVKAAKEAMDHQPTSEDLMAEGELSDSARLYVQYLHQYEEQFNYNNASGLMNLDPNSFYKGEISYYIDNHYEVEYPIIEKKDNTPGITAAYQAMVNSDAVLGEMAQALGFESGDTGYAKEMVDTNSRYGSTSSVVTNLDLGILTINVYSDDPQNCDKLLDIIEELLQQQKSEIEKVYGKHDLIANERHTFATSDTNLLMMQRDNIERLRDYSYRMTELEKSYLSEEDISAVEVFRNELTTEIQESLGVEAQETDLPQATVSKKAVAAGLVGGALMMMVLYALLYIMSSKVRLEDEVAETFGINLLGTVVTKEKKNKGLDGFLNRQLFRNKHLFEKEEALDMAVANISVMTKKRDADSIYLIGAASDDNEKSICTELIKRLKQTGIKAEYGRSVLYDAKSLEKAAQTGHVAVICAPEITDYNELAEELDVCISQKTDILGLLVIGE